MTSDQQRDEDSLSSLHLRVKLAVSKMQQALNRGGKLRLRRIGGSPMQSYSEIDMQHAIAVGQWSLARGQLTAANAAISVILHRQKQML